MSFRTFASSSSSSSLRVTGSRSLRLVAVISEAFFVIAETGCRERVVTNQSRKKTAARPPAATRIVS